MKQKHLSAQSPSYTRSEKVFQIIFLILILLCISFIFYNSSLSQTSSKSISLKVTERVNKTTASIGLKPANDNTVRKIAHFIEYFILGFFTFGFSASIRKRGIINAVFCSVVSLIVALTDETIQVFSNRGSDVMDVWLDSISACIAVFTFYFVLLMITKRKTRPSELTAFEADNDTDKESDPDPDEKSDL